MSKDTGAILAEIERIKKEEYLRGFRAGRVDAANKLIKLGNDLLNLNAQMGAEPERRVRERTRSKLTVEPGYREGTTIALVHQYIKDNPGKRGIDIINTLQDVNSNVTVKTVRTSLHRLKTKWGGLIKIENGRWYAND